MLQRYARSLRAGRPRPNGPAQWASVQSLMGRSAPSFTRSRKSFPGLKCGTYLPDNATASPVFGLRPWRGGRKCSEKLPKPRISMRSPCESASLMISGICFSASSTSLAGRCFCFAVMISMSSDLVMRSALTGTDVLLEQIPEGGARGRRLRAVTLHRLGLLVSLLGLDRQRDGARLAVDTGELRLDLIAHLEHRAGVLHALAAELGRAQLTLDTVAEIDDRAAGIDLLHHTLDNRALRVVGDIGGERVLCQLFDA